MGACAALGMTMTGKYSLATKSVQQLSLHFLLEFATDFCSCVRRTMVSQLVQHERIETTLPRAKELRRLADKVVTLGKEVRCLLASLLC